MIPVVGALPKRAPRATPRHYYGGKPAKASAVMLAGDFHTRGRFQPIITVRWGRRGKGKTLSLTAAGYHFKKGYEARGLDLIKCFGCSTYYLPQARLERRCGTCNRQAPTWQAPFQVVANYQVGYADLTHPYIVESLIEFPESGRNLHLMLDEIAVYFHRRRWMRSENLDFEAFATQIRKRNVEIEMATQFPQRIDSDIQDQIDLFIDCELYEEGCGNPLHRFCVAQRIHDWWGQWTGKTWRKPWPPHPWDYDRMMWFHNCDQFFSAYKDSAIHAAVWLGGATRDDMIKREWGDDVPTLNGLTVEQMDEVGADKAPARKKATDEIEEWDEYEPDLSKGKPGEDQLGEFLHGKLMKAQHQELNINVILKEAQNIDPNIKTRSELKAYCRGKGWSVVEDGRYASVRLQ